MPAYPAGIYMRWAVKLWSEITAPRHGSKYNDIIDMRWAGSIPASSITPDQILPAQTGQAGKVLTTDGTNPSWTSNTKHWTGTSIDGTPQTIIPNATGDVVEVITIQYAASEITGTDVSGGVVVLEPGDTFTVLTDGTNILTLTCAADGSVTIARSAGTDTYKFSAWMVWL
jgi:hypothetical protein